MSTPTTLREWRQLQWQLSHDLGVVEERARALGLEGIAGRAAAARERVTRHRFTVAVVGEFKRGKSTFINALLGRAILPADVAPTTATLHRITYGLAPHVELRHHDGTTTPIAVEALAEHATKWTDEAAARAATVREAVVFHPVRFCRNDVDLLDTPGLSDDPVMTAITLGVLPEVDAAIFVMMADSPLSETEGRFVEDLRAQGISDVLYVLGAVDRIRRPEDRARIVASVEERLAARLGARSTVYALSARDALDARTGEAPELLDGSGVPAFEAALESFLTGADRVGLRRRLETLASLADELTAAWPADAPIDAGTDEELARLDALLVATEAAVESWRVRLGDAVARVAVASEEPARKWSGSVRTATHAVLPRVQFGAKWAEGWGDLTRTVGEALVRAVGTSARTLAANLASNTELALDATGDPRALQTAAETVLRFCARQLSSLGYRGPNPELPAMGAAGDTLDVDRFAEALTPELSRFADALADPAIVDALRRVERKSGFDRLLALDFTGLSGQWVALAAPRVDAVVEAHLRARPVLAAVQAQLDEALRRRVARVAPITTALRKARAELVAFAERGKLRQEREAEARVNQRVELGTIAERARAAAAGL